MQTSIYFAQLLAPIMFFGGISLIAKRSEYAATFPSYFSSAAAGFFIGIFSLFIGLVIVLNHNVWNSGWGTLVTLLGWIAVIKSTALLIVPQDALDSLIKRFSTELLFLADGIVWIVFGVYLALVGYGN